MREFVYKLIAALPSKVGGVVGWLVMAYITVLPDDAKAWGNWLLSPHQFRLAGIVGLIVFSGYWILLFTIRPAPRVVTHMTSEQVIHWIVRESNWGWKTEQHREPAMIHGQLVEMRKDGTLEAPAEFHRLAQREGSPIRAWGRPKGAQQSVEIPHTFWMTNTISLGAMFTTGASETEPTAPAHHAPDIIYENVLFDQSGIEKAWPRRNIIQRVLTRFQKLREQNDFERALNQQA